MNSEFKNSVIIKAIDTYGEDSQTNIAVEEMSELIKALMKLRRNDVDKKEIFRNVAEEIADVEIMLEQLKLIFNCFSLVETEKEIKINRLAKRLEMDKSEQE